ncbi:Chemotaxis protein methyltransferase CheR [hydrothermal vent metagenome]|uniref:protein-glutamate O-methyltransferase n=1 Tax=hydrothermal vent metagenome TaxID=652676 RepID=A0A3B1BYS2_9ZZZZ
MSGLTNDMFRILRDIIHDMTGILYDESKTYLLENRILRRLSDVGLESFDEYLDIIHNLDAHPQEKEAFIDLVTTHETSFFRNAPQLDIFINDALPQILVEAERKGAGEVKIWSAGCSTGEEPYNIAMMMEMSSVVPQNLKVRVLGTDISMLSIKTAKNGLFDSYSLRNAPYEYLHRFFTKVDDKKFMISSSVANSVEFCQLNLLDEEGMCKMSKMDIIVCRNVLIYFDLDVRNKVAKLLHRSLRDGGLLFIGHSESFSDLSEMFTLETRKGIPVYRKKSM